jgi:hypothetical protein
VTEQPARIARLDDFGLAPDVVKLDVQGSELDVMRGAETTLAACRPLLLIEDSWNREQLMRYLAGFDYAFFRYDAVRDQLVSWQQEWPSPNYFAVCPERHGAWLKD